MTEVEFGGGSSSEQRSAFCAPKYGSKKPGYTGTCPRYPHVFGRSYGEHNHRIAMASEFRDLTPFQPDPHPPRHLDNELPESTNDKKLTKDMMPGYTGYIPRKKYEFALTYKNECDVSIDKHLTSYKKTIQQEDSLRFAAESAPRFQVLNHDPDVRDRLNTYRDTHPVLPVLAEPKRAFVEAPKCMWDGFVPRIASTDVGLGFPYHESAGRGFARMKHERDTHNEILKLPVNPHGSPSSMPHSENPVCKRVYQKGGMNPKWTGYVPGKLYTIGMNYGDAARSLEVCSHDKKCFSEHMRTRGPDQGTLVMF